MAETFPIKCGSCTEIIDVAADSDPVAAYNCPMCGAAIVIAEAVDFELPCPAEVVVEEQTPERLRFRLRSSLRGSNSHAFAMTVCVGFPILDLLSEIGIAWVRSGHLPGVFQLLTQAAICTLIAFFLASFILFGSTTIELSHGECFVRERGFFLPVKWQCPIGDMTFVRMRSKRSRLWPFRIFVYCTDVTIRWRGSYQWAESPNPRIARYVTHLLRRQLITMGHNLHNG
ncbi:hypothetical protein Mal52_56890 [Symmachiella dynata]|uniref:Uncharacterized protein n=1 Tax=Symmachiella dynata TaxID=2527995 RepID=A0A517ZXG0_9PLAN|nr:hypothetical protein Mal52_56890 [Symmachiella dynata]